MSSLVAEAAGDADRGPVGGGVGDGAVAVGGLDEAGVLAELDERDLDLGVDLLAVLGDLALRAASGRRRDRSAAGSGRSGRAAAAAAHPAPTAAATLQIACCDDVADAEAGPRTARG